MTLWQLAALVYQLLAGQLSIQAVLQRLADDFHEAAREHAPYAIETIAANGTNTVIHPTWGNEALLTAIQALNAPVLAAIAALPAGSDIVIPTAADNAAGIWAYVNGATPAPGTYSVGAQLAEAWGVLTELYRSGAWRINGNPWFTVEWPGGPITYLSSAFLYPTPDWSAVGSYTSVVDWLNGTDTSGRSWSLDADSGLATTYDTLPSESWYALRCLLRDTDLYPTVIALPPIWPGIADVTPGAPVALTDGLVLAGPMHGVLLDLTVLPSGGTAWLLGATRIPYNWGQVGFITDNGEMEAFQWLSAEHSVYLPRQLAVAASASFRVTRPCTATVTPFTIP